MKKVLLSMTMLALLFSACKKSDDGGGGGSKKSTLTTGKWRITSSSAVIEYPAPIGTQTVDAFGTLPACQQDNLYIFNSDGTGTTDEGATKCGSSGSQTSANGTWALLNNDTQLQIVASGMTITADILSFDNSGMTVKYVTNFNNIKTTTTTAYSHQ